MILTTVIDINKFKLNLSQYIQIKELLLLYYCRVQCKYGKHAESTLYLDQSNHIDRAQRISFQTHK